MSLFAWLLLANIVVLFVALPLLLAYWSWSQHGGTDGATLVGVVSVPLHPLPPGEGERKRKYAVLVSRARAMGLPLEGQ